MLGCNNITCGKVAKTPSIVYINVFLNSGLYSFSEFPNFENYVLLKEKSPCSSLQKTGTAGLLFGIQ
jgi:hypothetical protein